MLAGCGIDIEEFSRFQKHLQDFSNSSFVKLVLSLVEMENFQKFDPSICFPIAFSCKEAFFKAFGDSWFTSSIDWKDIQIIFHDFPKEKKYEIHLSGHAEKMYQSIKSPEIISDFDIFPEYVIFEVILRHHET